MNRGAKKGTTVQGSPNMEGDRTRPKEWVPDTNAIDAGANESSTPDWAVEDSSALQAKAGAAALAKAKKIAVEMAKGLDARLGRLIYASNKADAEAEYYGYFAAKGALPAIALPPPPQAPLKLFAQRVKQDATVFAVFSIE